MGCSQAGKLKEDRAMASAREHKDWADGTYAIGLFVRLAKGDIKSASLAETAWSEGIRWLFTRIGAKFPDVLEPASSPNHRDTFHSIAFAIFACFGIDKMKDWEVMKNKLISAAVLGLRDGYGSHLAADATTPKGLPLV
jgi:membrane-bound metal-dependent hydrolase YbcI (DUF457 family)